eukprot:jgi/Mesen1/10822/ME000093S10342
MGVSGLSPHLWAVAAATGAAACALALAVACYRCQLSALLAGNPQAEARGLRRRNSRGKKSRVAWGPQDEEGGSHGGGQDIAEGILGAIGNTPLIRIRSLSEATGCEILGKAEFLNPGGSVKDRVALQIITEALESGELHRGGLVTEGSAGSTGVSLAMVAAAVGCRCFVALPDDAAEEKAHMLAALGAEVRRVRPVNITHRDHFVNVARRRAAEEQARLLAREAQMRDAEEEEEEEDAQGEEREQQQQQQVAGQELRPPQVDAPEATAPSPPPPSSSPTLVSPTGLERDTEGGPAPRGPISRGPAPRGSAEEPGGTGGAPDEVEAEAEVEAGGRGEEGGKEEEEPRGGFFADQFENLANFRAHYSGTAPEIWRQTGGRLDAFVAAAGTGGTLAGVSAFLKASERAADGPRSSAVFQGGRCSTWSLAGQALGYRESSVGMTPPSRGPRRGTAVSGGPAWCGAKCDEARSSLYNRVTRGVLFTRHEAEGKRLRNPFDTVTEGIGINRLTANFERARLDGAFRGSDQEAVDMARSALCRHRQVSSLATSPGSARYLLEEDGLFLGSSSAMNCVGAVRVAQAIGPNKTIVTILCDGGHRHLTKFHNPDYLAAHNLSPSATGFKSITEKHDVVKESCPKP